jgi:hypothetical protein
MTQGGSIQAARQRSGALAACPDQALFALTLGVLCCAESGAAPSPLLEPDAAAVVQGDAARTSDKEAGMELGSRADASREPACLPSCIVELQAHCPPGEPCVVTYSGFEQFSCWDNGIRQRNEFTIADQGNTLEIWVKDAAGRSCYSVENELPTEGAESFTWYDSEGLAVATALAIAGEPSQFEVTCLRTGEVSRFDRASAACENFGDGALSASPCDVGECTYE